MEMIRNLMMIRRRPLYTAPPKAKEPPVVRRDDHVPVGDSMMEHMSNGAAGDGIIYLNDIGETVKLDKKGHPYKVGSGGRRFFRSSPRPRSKYTPEEWRALSIPDRTVAEKKNALEKEKAKKDEKKKKDDGAGSSKDKKKRKSKGKKYDDDPNDISPSIHLSKEYVNDDDECTGGRSPSSASTLSTDLPSDDGYLNEWEECTTVENEFGPRASWDPLNICDSNTGKVMDSLAVAYATPSKYRRLYKEPQGISHSVSFHALHQYCVQSSGEEHVRRSTGHFEQISRFL